MARRRMAPLDDLAGMSIEAKDARNLLVASSFLAAAVTRPHLIVLFGLLVVLVAAAGPTLRTAVRTRASTALLAYGAYLTVRHGDVRIAVWSVSMGAILGVGMAAAVSAVAKRCSVAKRCGADGW
jgi:hypothetical protein